MCHVHSLVSWTIYFFLVLNMNNKSAYEMLGGLAGSGLSGGTSLSSFEIPVLTSACQDEYF